LHLLHSRKEVISAKVVGSFERHRIMFGRVAPISGIVDAWTDRRTTHRSRNYRDIIIQHASKVAEAIGVSPETLTGWTEGNGEFTSEQADKILEFSREETKRADRHWPHQRAFVVPLSLF
jgi:hypothetical protein